MGMSTSCNHLQLYVTGIRLLCTSDSLLQSCWVLVGSQLNYNLCSPSFYLVQAAVSEDNQEKAHPCKQDIL